MREPKIHKGSATMTYNGPKIIHSTRVTKVSPVKPPDPPTKPPWRRFMDLNWKMGKPILKEGAREAFVETIKWLLGFKRQPAPARPT